ncbi:acyl carrier protein [Vitiosangium sp. GDMCC 1.1324]|uniref:acyl carrier protein n=1 Tax=Vitiosangium sp. (strain GDMCC 1.1324) TaxID=2138576 RepID=UPI000D35A0C2|nr:acyl carrier protein [Vitiosangium sp. GDMCC 1.1324]PTL79019.1 acyl carrier protein [Vitiosangium sp. GDMCC 1.1324]
MPQEVESKVNKILSNLLERKLEELNARISLKEDLDVDSTEMVEICSALEKAFGVEIDDSVEKKLKTVGDIYTLLEKTP